MHKNLAFMRHPMRHSHCHKLLMSKTKRPSVFASGRIVELHKQGLSQRAFTAEGGHSQTIVLNFLNDNEVYLTKIQGVDPKQFQLRRAGGLYEKTQADPHPKLRPLLRLTTP